jgi:methylated-DNA-[protein]-cysteine S-methyltransferase
MATLDFAAKVHKVVKGIKPGQVMTYKEVAQMAGSPHAARAVANLMAKNFDLAIPCHRVIRSDGTLGGYNRGGVEQKRAILLKEGYTFPI